MKRFLAILTIVAMLMTLTAAMALSSVAADGDTSVAYGAETVALTLIDPLNDAEKLVNDPYGFGTLLLRDGQMTFSVVGQFYDTYGVTTDALTAESLAGQRYIVLALQNTSDGDIYFDIQPTVANGGNIFISGELAANNPVKLVNEKGVSKDAKWSATKAINGRDCFIVPYKFSGYVFIPVGILADLGSLSTPYFEGDAALTAYGFHVMADDAVTVGAIISDVYACGELPEYRVPETEAPTEAPTETPTEAEATVPETGAADTAEVNSETNETAPASATATDAPSTDGDSDSGCASTLTAGGVMILFSLAGVACGLRKKKE